MKPIDCKSELLPFGGTGHAVCGLSDALSDAIMSAYRGKVTLIYLDPPFCTGKHFQAGNAPSARTLAYSDKLCFEEYMHLMRNVLTKCHDLLAPDGSLYLHIDYRMSAHMRLLLDDIFGANRFLNEIIWVYHSGGRSKTHFPRKHDTIFLYSRSGKPYFNLAALGTPRGPVRRNNMKRGLDPDGRVYYSIFSAGKLYKYYEDDPIYPSDVWDDIEHLHQRDRERVNYPTQKPEALLRRIITASSREGDTVCDLFSGSGVTAAVSHKLGRRWLAHDASPVAVATLRMRLIRDADRNKPQSTLIEYGEASHDLLNGIHIIKTEKGLEVQSKNHLISQLSLGHVADGVFHADNFAVSEGGANSMTVKGKFSEGALQVITNSGERVLLEI